ncbi:archaea-specific SMC-related protein [Halobacteriales archaeon Cl-PHB]
MTAQQVPGARLAVENVGGIEETEVSFEPGITVLAGRNATNRTSLLRAVMAALGSDRVSLKADADAGHVELELDGDTYTRTLERHNGTVVTGGDPYLEDQTELADLFAFLLESNEARRAVERSDDLREVLLRPVDVDAIKAEIDDLQSERNRIDAELEELGDMADRLPNLETERQQISDQIDEVEEELEAKRAELENADSSLDERRQEESDLDEAMSDLEAAQNEYTRVRQRLTTERNSIESLETELEELRAELEELPADAGPGSDLEGELDRLTERRDTLDTELHELQSVIQFNEKMLDGTSRGVVEALRGDADGAPTDELLPDDDREVVCWTCGSEVEQTQLEATLDRLRTVRQEKVEERSEVSDRVSELNEQRRSKRQQVKQRQRLERRITSTEEELADRRERVEDLEADREELETTVDDLEDRVRELETEDQDELLTLNREVNELEFERDQLESDLAEVTSEIERIEGRLDDREALEAEREELTEEIEERRTRIERLETDAVEQFNDHMDQVLDILDYDNLARIWIERKPGNDTSTFDLHVVRAGPDGAAYEDRIETLSESEREVTGLVFALAGYLVHDVHEVCPIMVLDSLEAIDAERIATLVEYVGDYADTLLVALLPEDAAALDDDYERITDI